MKIIVLLMSLLIAPMSSAEFTFDIPDKWSIEGKVIYKDGKKIGELTSKKSWSYETGEEFISAFKLGFPDDPKSTKFIESGKKGVVSWVCRRAEYFDGKGGGGIWYARKFWVNGPIITLYSHTSCSEDFKRTLEIAKTLKEI